MHHLSSTISCNDSQVLSTTALSTCLLKGHLAACQHKLSDPACACRAAAQRLGHLQLHSTTKAPYGSRTGQDRLFNINMQNQSQSGNGFSANPLAVHQQPPQSHQPPINSPSFSTHDSTPSSSSSSIPVPWYSRAPQKSPSAALESLNLSSTAPPHNRSPAVTAAAEMLGLDPSQSGPAGQQGWSYPPPRLPTAGTVDRKVELSDAVKSFLAKAVSGPFRPIYFDLETTGDNPGASAAGKAKLHWTHRYL